LSAVAPSFDLRLIDTPTASLPCVVRGPAIGPQLLIVPPLFEEMNRCRTLLTGIGRNLSAAGIGSWLPDLPGTGDSPLPSSAMNWAAWRSSIRDLADHISSQYQPPHLLAVRGGALLADAASVKSCYLLAPVASGGRLLRELLRARLAADQERGSPTTLAALEATLAEETLELAGYPISPQLAADLRAATQPTVEVPTRTATLNGEGDHNFEGPPVWRQAEPAAADALAQAVSADIATWIATCDAR